MWTIKLLNLPIQQTYEIDNRSEKGRALVKMTKANINPNAFEKLSVKLAAQVFSNRVYAAMQTEIKTGDLKTPTAKETANFVNEMSKLFDCLNSLIRFH